VKVAAWAKMKLDTFLKFRTSSEQVQSEIDWYKQEDSRLSVMKLDGKSLAVLRILAISCVVLLAGDRTPAQDRTGIRNPSIDMNGYLHVSVEAAKHRETRRISEEEFIRMSREPGTIILDARSRELYELLHVKGAINLSFPDIAVDSLDRTIPDKNTRILIYCNNNFLGAPLPFPTKIATASLNLSTFIALYNYGYRNVYELGPRIPIKSAKLEFEPSDNSQVFSRIYRDSLIQIERGSGGYLGVYLGDINEERARQLRLTEVRGAVVGYVDEGSPAARAGLRENDVILAFNDQKVLNRAQFYLLLTESTPGSKVTLGISRNGEAQNISVALVYRRASALVEQWRQTNESATLPATAADRDIVERARVVEPKKDALPLLNSADEKGAPSPQPLNQVKGLQQMANASRFYLGVNTAPLNEQLARYFNAARGGVLVTEVTTGGLAERAGMKAGDCIITVNDDPVTSTFDLNTLIERLFNGQALNNQALNNRTGIEFSLSIVREGAEQTINMKYDPR
jgi:phage shock protein E